MDRRYTQHYNRRKIFPSKWAGKAITIRGAAECITRVIMASTKRRAMDLNWFRSSLICLYVQVAVRVYPHRWLAKRVHTRMLRYQVAKPTWRRANFAILPTYCRQNLREPFLNNSALSDDVRKIGRATVWNYCFLTKIMLSVPKRIILLIHAHTRFVLS